MTKTKTLRLTFLAGDGKKKNMTITDPVDGLTSTEVQKQMASICAARVFEKDGVDLYNVPNAADYVERVVTNIFGGDETAEEQSGKSAADDQGHQAN